MFICHYAMQMYLYFKWKWKRIPWLGKNCPEKDWNAPKIQEKNVLTPCSIGKCSSLPHLKLCLDSMRLICLPGRRWVPSLVDWRCHTKCLPSSLLCNLHRWLSPLRASTGNTCPAHRKRDAWMLAVIWKDKYAKEKLQAFLSLEKDTWWVVSFVFKWTNIN